MNLRSQRSEPLSDAQMAEYQEFGFGEKFARLLFIRGIDTAQKVRDFFTIALDRMHDPFKLKGMREATDRINTAIQKKERILIIGDYDCDGICATAILYKYLISRFASTRYFLPNREADGYGLTCELIDKLNERFSPKLIITVDCGISCPIEVEHAKKLGIDVIVTDHHAIPENVPDCICVNPKFTDQEYPFDGLCGAGVALKLVHALSGQLKVVEKYLDICTIATVADIVPLRDENRQIVSLGLANLNKNSNLAVTALAKSCNIYGKIKAQDISYKIGPKINAAGRMGNAKRGIDLLLEKDEKKIAEIINSLSELNVERQKLCTDIYDEAAKMVEDQKLCDNNIIIVYKDEWEGGVLGIVAARLTDKYQKPSMVLSKSESGIYKGSARSVRGVNIFETLEQFSSLLSNFGGHTMAAGLSVEGEKLNEFVEKITTYLNENKGFSSDAEKIYDFELSLDDVNGKLVSEFEKLEPTGCENPVPSFLTEVASCKTIRLSNHPNHIRFTPSHDKVRLNLMYFYGTPMTEILTSTHKKNVIFEFQKQDDSSDTSLKGMVRDVIPLPSCDASRALMLSAHLLGHLTSTEEIETIKQNLTIDREVFVEYYMLIKKQKKRAAGLYDLYINIKVESNIDIFQFFFVATVLKELGVLVVDGQGVRVNHKIKTELERSNVYKAIKTLKGTEK